MISSSNISVSSSTQRYQVNNLDDLKTSSSRSFYELNVFLLVFKNYYIYKNKVNGKEGITGTCSGAKNINPDIWCAESKGNAEEDLAEMYRVETRRLNEQVKILCSFLQRRDTKIWSRKMRHQVGEWRQKLPDACSCLAITHKTTPVSQRRPTHSRNIKREAEYK